MQACQHEAMRAVEDRHWWYAVLRLQVMKALSQRLPRYAQILDAGCGTGGMMWQLPARWSCIGIDASNRRRQCHPRSRPDCSVGQRV